MMSMSEDIARQIEQGSNGPEWARGGKELSKIWADENADLRARLAEAEQRTSDAWAENERLRERIMRLEAVAEAAEALMDWGRNPDILISGWKDLRAALAALEVPDE